jgi:hypothetical protein
MSDHQVKLVLDSGVGQRNPVDTGIPQDSSAAPVLFITYLAGILHEVEKAVSGIKGLSIVDDIAWWAEGKDDQAVAVKLSETAPASLEWAAYNGVAFHHGKTEAAMFHRRRSAPAATIKVGDRTVLINKEATSRKETDSV